VEERWLPVVGYVGVYEVSDQGRVRSVDRTTSQGNRLSGRVLKQRPLPNGRPRVSLAYNGKTVDAYPYRLVLEAFVSPCPPGMEALHWDDDFNNNALTNLRWGTRTDNMRDMSRNGGGNAGVSHCPSGHPYSLENTYIYPSERKHRGCRECGRRHSESKRRKAQAKRKAAA
jgi:hypothetical protein